MTTGSERNRAVAVLRRLWHVLPWVDAVPFAWPYHFDFRAGDRIVFSVDKKFGLRDRYVVDIRDPRLDPPRREWAQQTRLAMSHPSLLGRQLSTLATLESDLAATLTARSPTDPVRARVMAAAFLVALRIAMQLWIEENEQAEDPMELMMITMDEMGARFV